jgi:hypothetical protein
MKESGLPVQPCAPRQAWYGAIRARTFVVGVHLPLTVTTLCRPGGARAVAAESLLLKQQLLISNRSRQRAPNLNSLDRFVAGLTTLFAKLRRIEKVAAPRSPATLFKFHNALIERKHSRLFSASIRGRKPGPNRPSASHWHRHNFFGFSDSSRFTHPATSGTTSTRSFSQVDVVDSDPR